MTVKLSSQAEDFVIWSGENDWFHYRTADPTYGGAANGYKELWFILPNGKVIIVTDCASTGIIRVKEGSIK